MSLKTVEPRLTKVNGNATPVAIPPVPRARRGPGLAGVVAAPLTILFALALHQWLPNQQTARLAGLYVGLLQALLAASVVLAVAHLAIRRVRPSTHHAACLLAGAIGWLAVWDVLTLKLNLLPVTYFPSPDVVLQGIAEDWREMIVNIGYSLRLALTGYVLGVLFGLASGVLLGWFRAVRFWGMPVMKLIGPLPAGALVPLAMVLSLRFSADSFFSGVLLVAFAVWFPVAMLTTSGIRNVPSSYFDVARTLGANQRFLIFRVAIPAALPTIFIGLFMGLVVSFLTFSVAETVGVKHGLAYYYEQQKAYAIYSKVYGALLLMAVACSALMTLLFKLRDWVLGWQKGVIRW